MIGSGPVAQLIRKMTGTTEPSLRKLLKARKEKERDEAEGKPAKDKAKDPEHAL